MIGNTYMVGRVEGRSGCDAAWAAQGMAFSVAMNSKRANAMVALLIASNFAEIKGVVLKRFDPRRLLILSYQVSLPPAAQRMHHCRHRHAQRHTVVAPEKATPKNSQQPLGAMSERHTTKRTQIAAEWSR